MKEIPLTQGKVALVDDDMYEELSRYKWYALRRGRGHHWYATRGVWDPKTQNTKLVSMHRQIMDAQPGQQIDHRNRKGLDNQRHNLRVCTNGQNQMNARKQSNCTSRYKGVYWDKARSKWQAQIKVQDKQRFLGRFDDEWEAAQVYNAAAIKHFGEFARLNAGRSLV